MKRREFMRLSAMGSASMLLGAEASLASLASQQEKPPNLLFVFPDQMRGQALGFLGEDPVFTPNLDGFAKESLVLPQTIANYPICSPFRAMMLTGKYPHSNGVVQNCQSNSAPFGCELPESVRCWSDVLQDKGYRLGYIGKWHLDSPHEPYIDCSNNRGATKWNEWCPPNRRHSFDFWRAYGTYDQHMNPMYWETTAKRDEFKYVGQWGPEYEADTAIEYLKNENGQYRKANQPFALVVSMNPPHMPYNQFPKKYLDAYEGKTAKQLLVRGNVELNGETNMSKLALNQTKNYFAMVTGVDDQFGRILQALKDSGLENNTIVVFMSDHGNCLGAHDQVSKNNHFEESLRVPFLIRWPGKIKPRQDDLLLSVPDLFPTLMELMGQQDAIPADVQGSSHAQLFLTGKGKRPSSQLYLKTSPAQPAYGKRGARTHRYKLVIDQQPDQAKQTILIDLQNDPYELKNIAEANPKIVAKLFQEELRPWLKKAKDPWKNY